MKRNRIRQVRYPCLLTVLCLVSSISCTPSTEPEEIATGVPGKSTADGPIAFSKSSPGEPQHIFLANDQGEQVKQLTFEGRNNFFPSWSPDGKRLAFSSDRGSHQRFWVISNGERARQEFIPDSQSSEPPGLSEGERILVSIGTSQIWVMEADGSSQTQLTTEGGNAHPVWSPNGRKIAFSSDGTGKVEIWVMDADGRDQQQLTNTSPASDDAHLHEVVAQELAFHGLNASQAEGVTNLFPTWSPDGTKLAFVSTRGGPYAIWVMDANGERLQQLTFPLGEDYPFANIPTWSPKGDKIAFWSGKDLGPGHIWVMDPDGTNRKQLTDHEAPYNADEPVWSPDGEKILYASNRPGGGGVATWIMNADGSNHKVFIPNTHLRNRPAWRQTTEH